MATRSLTSASSASTIGAAFSAQMSGQMPGWPAATRGHVSKAAGSEPEQGTVLLGARAGGVHQRGGHEVGHVGHHGNEPVVVRGREHEHVGAQAHDDALEPVERPEVRRGRRGQHPHGSLEEIGVGPVQADLLGPGHGVAPDEARVVGLGDDRRLYPAHVGHHDTRRAMLFAQDPACHASRGGRPEWPRRRSRPRGRHRRRRSPRSGALAAGALGQSRGRRRASRVVAARGRSIRRSARCRQRAPAGAPRPQSGRSSRSPWAPWR